jgi:selenophosphate synthetase-related protein
MPAGELEAVKEQAGAVGIDLVGGEAMDDLMERVLERGPILRKHDVEAFAAVTSDGGFAAGMVIVAMDFSAKSGRAAATCKV